MVVRSRNGWRHVVFECLFSLRAIEIQVKSFIKVSE
jgi:hypothetical protein